MLALGGAVFLASGILVFLLTADIFQPVFDEGIYLEGGHRVLTGQAPYRDFFAYTGPLIYWVQALLERVFGPDLRMMRLSVAFSAALTCFGIFRLGNCFAGWRSGLAVSAIYLAVRLPAIQDFTIGHRWLSTALMTAAIAAAVEAAEDEGKRWKWFAGGALMAAAAWATPTDLIVLLLLTGWMVSRRSRWTATAILAAAVAAVSAPAALWLAMHGAFWPMFDKLVWVGRHYERANSLPWGYYPFGSQNAALSTNIWQWVLARRPLIPAVLIPVCLAFGAIEVLRRQWRGGNALLVLLAFGMMLTTWPRWDVNGLAGVTPPCYAIAAALHRQYLGDRRKTAAYIGGLAFDVACLALAFSFAMSVFFTVNGFTYFRTRVGLLRNAASDAMAMDELADRIPAGAELFVFPYRPMLGYVLQTHNPTSYAYLQPGMMSAADEATVLGELQRTPPEFVLRQNLTEQQILKIWPGSDRASMRFQSIENLLDARYAEVETVASEHFRVAVLRRK